MKFTIAAGILARTLPVISEETTSSKHPTHEETRDDDLSRYLVRRKKHPTHTSHRALKMNTRRARFDTRIHSGNQLTNTPLPSTPVECDPMTPNADIGVLSCGPDYECVVDEQGSSLGGICVETSRELQDATSYACDLCGFGFIVGRENDDVVVDTPEAGFAGVITCGYLYGAAYVSYTLRKKTCPLAAEAAKAGGCCEAMCDLCGAATYVSTANFDIPVEVSVDRYDGATCESLVLASYNYGTVATSTCPAVAEAAKSAGCCYAKVCILCSYGEEVVDPYPIGTTCWHLNFAAYINKTISLNDCPAAVQRAETEGCCDPLPIYDDCNLCGDGTFYPDNTIFKRGPCGTKQSTLNETNCARFTPDFAPHCCAPPSGVLVAPTPAPQESTTASEAAPFPRTRFAASSRIALIGLTMLTTAGAVILT